MKHLRLNMMDLPANAGHPQNAMRNLGITYQHATPQSMMDSWWFWNCENIPEKLPSWLFYLNIDPEKAIGRGLSREVAQAIKARSQQ